MINNTVKIIKQDLFQRKNKKKITKIIENNTHNFVATKPDLGIEIKNKYKYLVLSGGAIKGIAHIGAFAALDHLGILDKIEIFAGSSAGTMTIAMYLIGYNPNELFEIMKLLDLNKLKNFNLLNIDSFGLDTGKRMELVFQKLIAGKGYDINITLQEVYNMTKKKMIFTTVCINTMEVLYLSHETHPELPLYLAIRMSSAVPVIFSPILYKGLYYIDGGCFDNYPISIFQNKIDEVLGILIIDNKNKIEKIDNLETYISQVIGCMMEGMTFSAMASLKPYEKNTIKIISEPMSVFNFEIDAVKKGELFKLGYNSVINKFKN